MPEETVNEAPPAAGRFRLPKLFAEAEEVTGSVETPVANGSAAAPNGTAVASNGSTAPAPHGPPASPAAIILEELGQSRESMDQMRDGMELMYRLLSDMSERETAQAKLFDTLYGELREYKNDFIYEHLKPVVRPLLFLFDSIEQFDGEAAVYEELEAEAKPEGLTANLVRQNMGYFREQLVEALRICEVTMMDTPEGEFNAKLHKAVGVEAVEAERDNHIVRVVRSGWYLNGQLLRSAEVVVGKAK